MIPAPTEEQHAVYHNQTAMLTWLRSLGHDVIYAADPSVPSIHLPPAHWSIGHACPYCGATMTKTGRWRITKDHVVPYSRGGRLTPRNRLIVCYGCNSDKGGLLLEEWLGRLIDRGDPRASIVSRLVP